MEKIEKTLEENRIKQANIDNLMQYEIINNYSICLALDYELDKIIKEEKIKKVNELYSKGYKQKEIAEQLDLSKGLVTRYLKNLKNDSRKDSKRFEGLDGIFD